MPPSRTLLLIAAIAVIAFSLYLLFKVRTSKTTLKVPGMGEISTTSVGLVALLIGAGLGSLCVQADEKHEVAGLAAEAHKRELAASAAPPLPAIAVSQSSTGDGSPNIGVVSGGSVTVQVDKSKSER